MVDKKLQRITLKNHTSNRYVHTRDGPVPEPILGISNIGFIGIGYFWKQKQINKMHVRTHKGGLN